MWPRFTNKKDLNSSGLKILTALRSGHLENASRIIDQCNPCRYYMRNSPEGYCILQDLVKEGNSKAAEILVPFFFKRSETWSDKGLISLLFFVSYMKHIQLIELVLDKGVSVNAVKKMGIRWEMSPLHFVISRRSLNASTENTTEDVVKFLLSKGASLSKTDGHGKTPLALAVESEQLQIAIILIEHGASVDHPSSYRSSCIPIHIACSCKSWELLEILLKHKANANAESQDGETPLLKAVQAGKVDFVRSLLEHGARVNSVSRAGKSPLYFAVKKSNLRIIKILLENKADVHIPCIQEALCVSLKRNRPVSFNANYSPEIKKKYIFYHLRKHGFVFNSVFAKDEKLLYNAAKYDFSTLLDHLLHLGADPNHIFSSKLINKLCHGFIPSIHDITPDCCLSNPLLHIAVYYKSYGVVQILLNNNCNINVQDESKYTALYIAGSDADSKMIKLLMAAGANVNVDPNILHRAVTDLNISLVHFLLENQVDVNARDARGLTPLQCAINRGELSKECHSEWKSQIIKERSVRVVSLFMKYYSKQMDKYKEELCTGLFFLCKQMFGYINDEDYHKMLTPLLQRKDIVNSRQDDGYTPLLLAVEAGNSPLIQALLENGADVTVKTMNNDSVLHLAVKYCEYKVVYSLINQFGADTEWRDGMGRTPLHVSNFTNLDCLLDCGADINATCKKGLVPFENSFGMAMKAFILEQHVVKMKTLGLPVHCRYKLESDDPHKLCQTGMKDLVESCLEEIGLMKVIKITSCFTLFDLFKNWDDPVFVVNNVAMTKLESSEVLDKLQEYIGVLKYFVKKSKVRYDLLKSGQLQFSLLLSHSHERLPQLPAEIVWKILTFLMENDLNNVIKCGKDLKCQLS